MKIVTGHRGEPHITPNDNQGLNQAIFGNDNYILAVGNRFEATLDTATSLSIQDGEGMMQGVHFRMEPGTVDTVELSSGVAGYNRIDLVCARYTKDSVTGVEDVQWVVIEGDPSAEDPEEPAYTEGDILAGDLVADFPIVKVTFTGLTPEAESIAKINGDNFWFWDTKTFTTSGSGSGTGSYSVPDDGNYMLMISARITSSSNQKHTLYVGWDENPEIMNYMVERVGAGVFPPAMCYLPGGKQIQFTAADAPSATINLDIFGIRVR